MKYLILISLLLAACATQPFENWSKENTYYQVAYSTLHVLDWLQTREGICESDKYYEINPITGPNPSKQDVDIYMGTTLILQLIIPGLLNEEWRKNYQLFWIGAEGGTVIHNYKLGIRF